MSDDLEIKLIDLLEPQAGQPDAELQAKARLRLLTAATKASADGAASARTSVGATSTGRASTGGDAPDDDARREPAPRQHRVWHPPLAGRTRLLALLGAVVLGGGVAATAAVLSAGSTVLAARGVNCLDSTPAGQTAATAQAPDVGLNGGTPQAACAAALHVSASDLVVCSAAPFAIDVYVRSGDPAQECRSEGMKLGVPAGFADANARVATLARDLNRLYASRNCFTVPALTAGSRTILRRLGFKRWTVVDTHPITRRTPVSEINGHCAQFAQAPDLEVALTAVGAPSAASALAANSRQVQLASGPSRDVERTLARINRAFTADKVPARATCTIPQVERSVTAALRHDGAPARVLFAAFSVGRGEAPLHGATKTRYMTGCTVPRGASAAPNGRTILVELLQRRSRPFPAVYYIPLRFFHAGSR